MPFHRLTVPTYFGGLPASGYDYINNAVTGTPAPVSAQQSGGTYDGTYFEVPLESAEATKVNRANNTLAENCDYLDDVLRTSRPVLAYADFGPTTGGETKVQLTGDVFVGRAGVSPINQEERDFLIAIVDQTTMQQLVIGMGTPHSLVCTNLYDSADSGNVIGTEADGYHTDPWVYLSAVMPAGISFRVIYLRRATVVGESDPADATGDMGYLAGYLVKATRRGAANNSFYLNTYSGWHDGSGLSSSNVNDAIDEITNLLGDDSTGTAGAEKVGAEGYLGIYHTLAQGSVESQLQGLADSTYGAEEILAVPYTGVGTDLSAGTVQTQLRELADELGGLATANTWAQRNTFSNGIQMAGSPNIISTNSPQWRMPTNGTWQLVNADPTLLVEVDDNVNAFELHNLDLVLGRLSDIIFSSTLTGNLTSGRTISINQNIGTGGADGFPLNCYGQRGENVTGGNNSDGGPFVCGGGLPGTGGVGGWYGTTQVRRYSGIIEETFWREYPLTGTLVADLFDSPAGNLANGEAAFYVVDLFVQADPAGLGASMAYRCRWILQADVDSGGTNYGLASQVAETNGGSLLDVDLSMSFGATHVPRIQMQASNANNKWVRARIVEIRCPAA